MEERVAGAFHLKLFRRALRREAPSVGGKEVELGEFPVLLSALEERRDAFVVLDPDVMRPIVKVPPVFLQKGDKIVIDLAVDLHEMVGAFLVNLLGYVLKIKMSHQRRGKSGRA